MFTWLIIIANMAILLQLYMIYLTWQRAEQNTKALIQTNEQIIYIINNLK